MSLGYTDSMETEDYHFVELGQTKQTSNTLSNNKTLHGDIRLRAPSLFWRKTVMSLEYHQVRLAAEIMY